MERVAPSAGMRETWEEQWQAGQPLGHCLAEMAAYVIQVTLEEAVTEFLGRVRYGRDGGTQPGWRNGYGHRTVQSELGALRLRPPKVRGTAAPYAAPAVTAAGTRCTGRLRDLVAEAYVRGLSVREVEALVGATVGGRVSKSAASRATAQVDAVCQAWRTRDLSAERVLYLFLDGQYHAVRPGSREQEGILVAYAFLETGAPVLLHLDLGPRESTEAWLAFLHDLTARGLGAPLLVITDGNPGRRRAVKQVFPGVRLQRCQVHKLRNLLAKLPRRAQGQLKPLLQQVFLAPNYATAIRRAQALVRRYRARYTAAMECLVQDLEECLTYLHFPAAHRKRIRTTNLLERTFGESRRRTKVIPRFPGERACLKLVYAALMTAAAQWRGVPMTLEIRDQLQALRSAGPGVAVNQEAA